LRIAGGADVAEQRAQLAAEALTAAPLPTGRAGHAPRRAPPLVHAALRQPGRPLDEPLGELFGAALGHDLGDVEVHDGELASRSAEAIGARAYSVGHHVVLGAPSSRVTRLQLLAHELAHVSERAEVVHCYESGEHAQAGDAARKVTINGITLDEGDLVALGDFYEKPEDIYKAPAAELSQLVTFIERDKKYYAGQGGTPVSNAEWAAVTKNRPADQQYLELAKRNDPHFAPHASGRPGEKGDHKAQWREYHRQAILAVIAAAAAGKTGVPRRRLCSTALPRTSSPTPSPPGTSSTRTT
jgi:hypothetical protein